jgi:hypothetical protein
MPLAQRGGRKALTTPTVSSGERQPRDAASWAQQVWRLKVRDLPSGALNFHVEPLAGLRTHVAEHLPCPSLRVSCAAERGHQTWKEHVPEFWMPSRKLCTERNEADRKEFNHDHPIT